jgi:hypothetical protein
MWSFLVYSKILLSQPIDIEAVYNNRRVVRAGSLVSYKMSLKEQAFLTQDEPEGGEVAQAGD